MLQPVFEHSYSDVSEGIQVTVKPFYVKDRSDEDKGVFFYAYRVIIKNVSDLTVQLKKRHWIIRDGNGHVEHVRGEGVVGEQPILGPGQSFHYTSFCPLRTPTGNMRGEYLLTDEFGHDFLVNIPVFFLRQPQTFH